MKRHKFYPDNRHNFHHYARPPVISTSESYRGNLVGHTHSVWQDYNKDSRYYPSGSHRGYNKQRDNTAKNEHYRHGNYARTHNNNLTVRKPAASPHYYHKSDYHQPRVSHYHSEPSLTDVTSYHESEITYRESLVSVASSLDDLQQHRIESHKRKQQQHYGHAYPYSDTEGRHAHHVYSIYSSDDQKRRDVDAERETRQEKNTRLHRRHTDETFSASRTKNNNKNYQIQSQSVYNTTMSSDNSGNSSGQDVVYIPVVILPEKNTSTDSNTVHERVVSEQAFNKRKYAIQHNVANDTIIETDETLSDIPDPYTKLVYRKVKGENFFKENECPILNNTARTKKIQDMNAFDEKLSKMMPLINDGTVTDKHFLHFIGPEAEKLQDIVAHSDNENITMSDPLSIPIMVAGFNTVTNPFSNPIENIKPKLTSSASKFNGTNKKKSVVQHSQSVQASENCVSITKDEEVQVSDMTTITAEDGDVQTSEINPPALLTADKDIIFDNNKSKGDRQGIISDVTLSTHLSHDEKVKKCDSCKGNEIITKYSKNGSEGKHKEIIHETNDCEENKPSKKTKEEYSSCQHRICKKESNNKRQHKNKMSNEKNHPAQKSLVIKTDYKEMPKTTYSSYFQQDPYESPFKRLFNNDCKMKSRPTYFPFGMYTDNPMMMQNTYNWLINPNKEFVESTSSSFRTIPKHSKNVQTAYPFFTKVKKVLSKSRFFEKKDDKEASKRENVIKKEEKQEKEEKEIKQQELIEAEKISKENIREKDGEEIEKREETKSDKQIEVNLTLLFDYIIQGFNLYLGKTVHTVLIDSIYTLGTVAEKFHNIN